MSRKSALDPKFPFLPLQGRGAFGILLATPWGEHAASESETAVGLGTLRPPHCCQRGWGRPAEIRLPGSTCSHRQILPARWAAVGTAHSQHLHPLPNRLPVATASGSEPAGGLPEEAQTQLGLSEIPGSANPSPRLAEQVKSRRGEGWRAGAGEDPSCLSSWWRQNSHQSETNPSFFPGEFLFGAFVRTAKT